MSLHAELTEEARAQLHAQRRNSTISSLVIAFLVVVLIALLLGIFLLPNLTKEVPVIVTYESNLVEDTELTEKKVQTSMERKPSSPSSSMAKVIAANTASPTAVPVPDVDVLTPSMDFGDGNDFGDGWGDGSGNGGGFGAIPATMKKRCSKADRMARLKESGGNERCEKAVMKALRWLQETQNEDGSWTTASHAAMTGFAILAYLGHCETPNSPEFGETVLRGITYLIDVGLKNDYHLTAHGLKSNHWVYEHGIATYALAESYTFCSKLGIDIPDLGKVTKEAGDIIMKGQGESGGWIYRFAPTNGGDNSVGYWQVLAVKACKHTGLWADSKFTKPARKALEWLEKSQGPNGGIGYRGPEPVAKLTGGGVLCFQMWGKGKSKNVRNGIKLIADTAKFNWKDGSSNLYYHYYHAQAMMNYGGSRWQKYNKLFRDELLDNQQKDGTWISKATGHSNLHMNTCLATFMLEVYYRFLPGTGGK